MFLILISLTGGGKKKYIKSKFPISKHYVLHFTKFFFFGLKKERKKKKIHKAPKVTCQKKEYTTSTRVEKRVESAYPHPHFFLLQQQSTFYSNPHRPKFLKYLNRAAETPLTHMDPRNTTAFLI